MLEWLLVVATTFCYYLLAELYLLPDQKSQAVNGHIGLALTSTLIAMYFKYGDYIFLAYCLSSANLLTAVAILRAAGSIDRKQK